MAEEKRYIILKITDDGLFYNERHYFQWKHTNFPDKYDFAWREHHSIYWKVEMLNFDRTNHILDVFVEEYNETNISSFAKQNPKGRIGEVHFHGLCWSILQTQLRSYLNSSFLYLQGDENSIPAHLTDKQGHSVRVATSNIVEKRKEKLISELSISIKVDIMDIKFKTGCVECLQYFPEIDESLKISIYNDDILPQFDHIKPYFKKHFKNKKIDIRGLALLSEDGEWKTKCHSQQIALIDEAAIASIRRMVLKDRIAKPVIVDIDKSLFTAEDIFLDEQDIDLGKALGANEVDLLKDILDLKGVRNRKQLIYLSGKVQSENTAIRYTLAPQFGFLFYAKGQEMSHFIWELINSHATYIWSTEDDAKLLHAQFKSVETFINVIRNEGRRAYLADPAQEDFIFSRISHQKANSNVIDHFPLWKARLAERLV